MEKIYIKKMQIKKVRHLTGENIEIGDSIKNLILTGKNGSGKTSVLDSLSVYLNEAVTSTVLEEYPRYEEILRKAYEMAEKKGADQDECEKKKSEWLSAKTQLETSRHGLDVEFSVSHATLRREFETGEFVLAYYRDERKLCADIPRHVEKIELRNYYGISEEPGKAFVKYLLDMKMTEALAAKAGKNRKANEITKWFESFEEILQELYADKTVKLDFDEETFQFHILQDGKEPFGFNELSRGFAAILDIIVDLMMRMEKQSNRTFKFNLPGIVLIDEIETHLHLEMQKRIMDCLTRLFPNIQFIVSTHSPFVLNSIGNAVIYDLEKKITVSDGLQDVPYDGIVESYFNVDRLSHDLRVKFEKYKELTSKPELTDNDFARVAELELYLSEIPDYLALDISTEFLRLKSEFERREDV